jgi:hypothetical protein
VARTVRRVPEVMVKVSGGGTSTKAVVAHFKYLNRRREFEIETDDGEHLRGRGLLKNQVENWDLEFDAAQWQSAYRGTPGRKPAKLVHTIVLSIPAGTPPGIARCEPRVRARAIRVESLNHRYAMVLHTDQPHPHVHLVVKAMSEQGERLNIRKATLREWRHEFARHLREQGIATNATDRAVRGESRTHKTDSIYRADQDGRSTHIRERTEAVARKLLNGDLRIEPGK